MITASQRLWESIYAAALVNLSASDDEEYLECARQRTGGVPNIMLDAADFANMHARFATFKPLSRLRKRSR